MSACAYCGVRRAVLREQFASEATSSRPLSRGATSRESSVVERLRPAPAVLNWRPLLRPGSLAGEANPDMAITLKACVLRRKKVPIAATVFADRRALISTLDDAARPTAVAGLVVTVVVDAVEGSVGWPFAHVCEEVLVSASSVRIPAITDCYTAAAVVLVARCVRIEASLKHAPPRDLLGRVRVSQSPRPTTRAIALPILILARVVVTRPAEAVCVMRQMPAGSGFDPLVQPQLSTSRHGEIT